MSCCIYSFDADLSALSSQGSASTSALIIAEFDYTVPYSSVVIVGSTALEPVDVYEGISGPESFGSGGSGVDRVFASSGSGDKLAIIANLGIYVPDGYISNTSLDASSTWTNHSFESLGLNPGTYTWTWGTSETADFFTLNIGVVPIPASLWLFGSGLIGLIGLARRKTRI